MRNSTGLVIRRSCYVMKFALLLTMCSLLVGCAIFSDKRPKPVQVGEVRFHIQAGDRHLNEGNYDRAVESYAAAIKLDPKSIEGRRKLGEAHASHGKIDVALDEFARIIEIDPNYAHAYNYRGYLYISQEKWEEAAKEFQSALEVAQDNLYSLNQLGAAYLMLGRFEDAKDVLQKAVELDPEMDDPESRDTHNYLGRVYRDEGEYEKAMAEFSKTLEHFPTDIDAHKYLGTTFERMEQYRDAVKEYEEVLKIDPDDAFVKSKLEELQQSGAIFREVPPVNIVRDDPEHYISSAPDASEYPGAGAIVLLDKLSYEITDGGSARYTVHQIVKICDDRGIAEFGEIAMPFNSKYQNIGVNVARTILPDGTEVEAAIDAFHDITPPGLAEYNLYSDTMLKVVSMPALRPGAILEYKVSIEDALAVTERYWVWGGMAFQWVEPVLTSKCVLRVPKDVEIKWKLYNGQIDPVITEDNENLTYIWISKGNPGIDLEAAMPPLGEVVPLLMFSTSESWQDVYKWYRELAEPQERIDDAIKRKVAELITGKATKEEKTKAISEFVASEIRYVAIELGQGAYQPYLATDVFKYRYGDCKDKVTLLITMLREAGIDAYPVLISPAPHRKADMEIPSIGQFSHVIAAVPMEEESTRYSVPDTGPSAEESSIQHPASSIQYVWLDPTIATCRYGDLPAGDQGRKAFVIGKDSGEFVDTPVYPSGANKIVSTSEVTLLGDGTIRGWERTTVNGQADMYLRAVYRLVRSDRRKKFLESILNQRYPGVEIENISMSDLYDLDAPLEVKVDFSCPSYGSNHGDMLIFPVPNEGFSAYATLVGSAERQYDLHLGYNMAVEKVLTLSLPEGYRVASLPEDRSVEHKFATFVRKYEEIPPNPPLPKGDSLEGSRGDFLTGGNGRSAVKYSVSLKINVPVIPAVSYTDLKKLLETAAREDRAQIVLTK